MKKNKFLLIMFLYVFNLNSSVSDFPKVEKNIEQEICKIWTNRFINMKKLYDIVDKTFIKIRKEDLMQLMSYAIKNYPPLEFANKIDDFLTEDTKEKILYIYSRGIVRRKIIEKITEILNANCLNKKDLQELINIETKSNKIKKLLKQKLILVK